MRALARDPFARTTLVRDTILPLAGSHTCDFCGGVATNRRRRVPIPLPLRHRAGAVSPRVARHREAFCSRSCHDASHD